MTGNTHTVGLKPQQFAQVLKMGSGWAIVRNSATLAISDYERVAHEIVEALNDAALAKSKKS